MVYNWLTSTILSCLESLFVVPILYTNSNTAASWLPSEGKTTPFDVLYSMFYSNIMICNLNSIISTLDCFTLSIPFSFWEYICQTEKRVYSKESSRNKFQSYHSLTELSRTRSSSVHYFPLFKWQLATLAQLNISNFMETIY